MTGPGRATPGRRAYPAREQPASRCLAATQHTKGSSCAGSIPRFGSQLPNTDRPYDQALKSRSARMSLWVGALQQRCISENQQDLQHLGLAHATPAGISYHSSTNSLTHGKSVAEVHGKGVACGGAPSRGPGRRRQRERSVRAASSSRRVAPDGPTSSPIWRIRDFQTPAARRQSADNRVVVGGCEAPFDQQWDQPSGRWESPQGASQQ